MKSQHARDAALCLAAHKGRVAALRDLLEQYQPSEAALADALMEALSAWAINDDVVMGIRLLLEAGAVPSVGHYDVLMMEFCPGFASYDDALELLRLHDLDQRLPLPP